MWTKMSTLPVGTEFRVHNGAWDGEIVDINGVKHLRVIDHEVTFDLTSEERKDYELDITIGHKRY